MGLSVHSSSTDIQGPPTCYSHTEASPPSARHPSYTIPTFSIVPMKAMFRLLCVHIPVPSAVSMNPTPNQAWNARQNHASQRRNYASHLACWSAKDIKPSAFASLRIIEGRKRKSVMRRECPTLFGVPILPYHVLGYRCSPKSECITKSCVYVLLSACAVQSVQCRSEDEAMWSADGYQIMSLRSSPARSLRCRGRGKLVFHGSWRCNAADTIQRRLSSTSTRLAASVHSGREIDGH